MIELITGNIVRRRRRRSLAALCWSSAFACSYIRSETIEAEDEESFFQFKTNVREVRTGRVAGAPAVCMAKCSPEMLTRKAHHWHLRRPIHRGATRSVIKAAWSSPAQSELHTSTHFERARRLPVQLESLLCKISTGGD